MAEAENTGVVNKRILLDIDRCIGCRSCETACFYAHTSEENLTHSEAMVSAQFPYHCRHCEDPVCLEACPNDAITRRDDGIIVRNKFKCTGCGSCAIACPFGAINKSLTRKIVDKCNLCFGRLEKDMEPACVSTCTSGALQFVPLTEAITSKKWGARVVSRPGLHRL